MDQEFHSDKISPISHITASSHSSQESELDEKMINEFERIEWGLAEFVGEANEMAGENIFTINMDDNTIDQVSDSESEI